MSFFASSRRGGAAAPRRHIAVAGLSLNSDLVRYREGYPGESLNNASLRANLRFYKNEIKSVPDGDFVDAMHDGWWRDYRKLEVHHGYVQWLFPIHEEGMNSLLAESGGHIKRHCRFKGLDHRVDFSFYQCCRLWSQTQGSESDSSCGSGADEWGRPRRGRLERGGSSLQSDSSQPLRGSSRSSLRGSRGEANSDV